MGSSSEREPEGASPVHSISSERRATSSADCCFREAPFRERRSRSVKSYTSKRSTQSASPGPSRNASFLIHGPLDFSTAKSPTLGRSIQSITTALAKSSTFREANSPVAVSLTLGERDQVDSPIASGKYQDLSKETIMANLKPNSRSHRQLRPLRKGVLGLSETDLHALGERVRLAFYDSGVIRNRRWRLISQQAAFFALDAIEWLVSNGAADTQQQAVTIMTCLQRNGIILNITEDRDFSAANCLFRFRVDDQGRYYTNLLDLVDLHTSNFLQQLALKSKTIIGPHTLNQKLFRLSFVPREMIRALTLDEACSVSKEELLALLRLLQESRCIVQVFPPKPTVVQDVDTQLFRFGNDHKTVCPNKDPEQRRIKKPPMFLNRFMPAGDSLMVAVKSPIHRAKTILRKGRREIVPDRVQHFRPEIWDGVTVTLVASLQNSWGFTLHGTAPVRVASVDKEGPARKLLRVGDVFLQVEDLDVFRMSGQQVMNLIKLGKSFCRVTIHQKPLPSMRPLKKLQSVPASSHALT